MNEAKIEMKLKTVQKKEEGSKMEKKNERLRKLGGGGR